MKTREEQIAEHDAKPFPVDTNGMLTSKCTAIIENDAVVAIYITSPYPRISEACFEQHNKK